MSQSQSPMYCVTQNKKSKSGAVTNCSDCISNLPDVIISEILSRLPIKDAVRTCLLSKDWESKWTSIYTLDLDDRKFQTEFVNSVERILLYSQNIKNFRLSCQESYDSGRMASWIGAVLRRNVESFKLKYYHRGIILPRSLLSCCTSLKMLELASPCTFKVHGKINFQNLKLLCLTRVEVQNANRDTDVVELIFPVLKQCKLIKCKWLDVKYVKICAPALISFHSDKQRDGGDYSICIIGARLTRFEICGGLLENFILSESLVVGALVLRGFSVTGDQSRETGLQIRKLLHGLPGLESLHLTGSCVKAIVQSKPGGVCISNLDKLGRLIINSYWDSKTLIDFLHEVPYVKSLTINVHECYVDDYVCHVAVESIPVCISHLEKVKFRNYCGRDAQLQLAKLILKNGLKLKKVSLHGKLLRRHHVEDLSAAPIGSACLAIVVPDDGLHSDRIRR